MPNATRPHKPFNPLVIFIGFAVFALLLVFSRSIEENLEVDENVFIASGALLTKGIIPYRDYHYNHMPTLVMIYAGLFQISDHLLLIARSFSALCGAAAVTIMAIVAWRAMPTVEQRRRLTFAVGIGLLFLFNPLFVYTTGLAWNHDFPLLCCLLGFLTLDRGLTRHTFAWIGIAGVLIGLAATTRITFVTTLLPFGLFLLLFPGLSWRKRSTMIALFVCGVILASLPSIWIWMQSPHNAWFGNFVYPGLNTRYHWENDVSRSRPFSILARLVYLVKICFTLPGNGVVVVSFIVLMAMTFRFRKITSDPAACRLFIVFMLVSILTAAGFAAAPLQRQYLYAATPFMILGITLALAMLPRLLETIRFRRIAASCVALTIVFTIGEFDGLLHLFSFRSWTTVQIHDVGTRVAKNAPPGKILTIEPVYALEGGRDIYVQLATGRFGVRAGRYLTEAQQAQYIMPGPGDLVGYFATNPPAAVFFGDADRTIEAELRAQAKSSGFSLIELPPVGTLWIAPTEPARSVASSEESKTLPGSQR